MVSKPWRTVSRPKQVNGKKLMQLEQTVKEVLNGNPTSGNTSNDTGVEAPALVNPDGALLKEIADLKVKLAAALEQGAMDRLKALQMEAVKVERDELRAQLDTLTVAQPLPVAVTNTVECSIQYDVKSPELARWRNDGWEIKHYEFVDNDRKLPVLAVVMERPAATTPRTEDDFRYSVTPPTDVPSNAESAPVNEYDLPSFTGTIIIEEPEAAPVMTAKSTLMQKLAADKPIFAAIAEYGAPAVLDAMDAQVYEKARAAYDAYDIPNDPPRRFESLLTAGTVTIEADEIEAALS
jgi:hypothetical protein